MYISKLLIFTIASSASLFIPHKHEEQTIYIRRGADKAEQVDILRQVTSMPRAICLVLTYIKFRHGEYLIPANVSGWNLIRIILQSRTVQRKLTIPEGLSVKQTLDLIKYCPYLTGNMPSKTPPEGSMIGDTYTFNRGISRSAMINIIVQHTDTIQNKLWQSNTSVWQNKTEWLTFASILEKEGKDRRDMEEIGGVLWNRLTKNIRLQVDATAIYAKTNGMYDQILTWDELQNKKFSNNVDFQSKYNTYANKGLPPTPIANPSIQALEVALYPKKSKFLYYRLVNGKHIFTKSFDMHKQCANKAYNLSE